MQGSSGDRTFFYYHNLKNITNLLKLNNFEKQNLIHKTYKKNDKTYEMHTIIIAEK